MKESNKKIYRNVQFLLFADDLMLVAEKEEDVERNLRILENMMAKRKMKTGNHYGNGCEMFQ